MNARMRKLFMLECNCCCCCCCCCWCCFHRDDLVSTAPRYISRKWVERCQTTETQELSPDFSTRPPIPDLCAEMISPPCASPSGLTSQAFQHLWTIPKKEGIVPIHRDNTTYLHTDSHTHTHTHKHRVNIMHDKYNLLLHYLPPDCRWWNANQLQSNDLHSAPLCFQLFQWRRHSARLGGVCGKFAANRFGFSIGPNGRFRLGRFSFQCAF